MKNWKLIVGAAAAASFLFVGCGGGSDDAPANGGDTIPATSNMTPQNVDDMATTTAGQLGCVYTSNNPAPALRTAQSASNLLVVKKVTEKIVIGTVVDTSLRGAPQREVQVENGNCGGNYTLTSTDTTFNIVFNDYCTTDLGGVETKVNGSANIQMVSLDPINVALSTPNSITVKSTNPETNEQIDVEINVQNGQATQAADGSTTLTASSVYIKDNVSGEEFSATNLSATMSENGNIAFSADMVLPDLGPTHIVGDITDAGLGTITLTSGGDTTVITSTSEGVFTVTTNGTQTGVMDCSMVETDSLLEDVTGVFP